MSLMDNICEHDQCGKEYSCPSRLKVHMRVHTKERPFRCHHGDCTKTFAQKWDLLIHQFAHTEERPHPCEHDKCGKAFKTSMDLLSHMHVHTEERPYLCDHVECGKAFKTLAVLRIHKRKHTGEQPFRCQHEECDQAFSTSGNLATHMRVHSKERPFRCDHDECNKTFTQKAHLTTHSRVHTNERPFLCDHDKCGLGFKSSSHLAVHKRVHSGERPHLCDHEKCGQSFATPNCLAIHKRVHTGARPYLCGECGDAFVQRGHLTNHMRSMHDPDRHAREKKQEQRIVLALTAAGLAFRREVQIKYPCTDSSASGGLFARIDFHMSVHDHLVLLEVDENQHASSSYSVSCDATRMEKVHESLALAGNTLPVIFVRYNPHAYRVDGSRTTVPKVSREARLVALLASADSAIYTQRRPLAIQYMYYNSIDGRAEVLGDSTYPEDMAALCLPSII